MPKPMPDLTVAAAAPPDRKRVYFEGCGEVPFSARAGECDLGNAWWLAEAALAAYETFGLPGHVEIDLAPLREAGYRLSASAKGNTQFLAIENEEVLIVAFRGTRLEGFALPILNTQGFALNWGDVVTDARLRLKPVDADAGARVHAGFLDAYGVIDEELAATLAGALGAGRPIWFCGHSLGGALATIAAYKHRTQAQGLYTFGSPRVGNGAFAKALEDGLRHICRFVHHHDAVTAMPPEGPRGLGYVHVGQLKYISGRGTWQIDNGESARHSLGELVQDAIAHAREVMQVFGRQFSLTDPGSWPIGFEAVADHSPVYYTNKIFNAREAEHRNGG